jgi:hypothetical protein
MNRPEQIQFVRDLTNSVAQSLIEKADKWPADWDGHELRVLIRDAFVSDARISVIDKEPRTKRARDYRNVITTENL